MQYRCLGINGFAGDRTPEAMVECHPFARALSEFLGVPLTLYGNVEEARNLPWKQALSESAETFSMVARAVNQSISDNCIPILVTPRCASAIASLPVVASKFTDVIVIYFDAHGDLNIPATSSSGYLGGMPITAAMGFWESGYGGGLDTKNLVHIGGRDFDTTEKAFVRDNKIMTLTKEQIDVSLDQLSTLIQNRDVYIHIDTDVYDPTEVVAEYSVEDGLFRQHVDSVISLVQTQANLVGLEITELSPKNADERKQSYQALFDSLRSLLKKPAC